MTKKTGEKKGAGWTGAAIGAVGSAAVAAALIYAGRRGRRRAEQPGPIGKPQTTEEGAETLKEGPHATD